MVSPSLTFELLAADPNGKTRSSDVCSLLYLLRGYSDLWREPVVQDSDCRIIDGSATLAIISTQVENDSVNEDAGRAFFISLSGAFEEIEWRRLMLLEFLKRQADFELLYVVKDEASEHVACQLYPHLYQIENLLRGYLIKFLSARVGPEWWDITVRKEVAGKARGRKGNETVFGEFLKKTQDAYLVDFGELGEIVHTQTSGFVTREDIVSRIRQSEETAEALRQIKSELQTNYQRFFKESFADAGFDKKWKEFEKLRNKIAHCNLFTADDLERGEQLAEEIKAIIREADSKTPQINITPQEREAIQESLIGNNEVFDIIPDEVLIDRLRTQQERMHRKNGFVGISWFVKSFLAKDGFDIRRSYESITRLEGEGMIDVYQVDNPGSEHPVTAIRLVEDDL